MASHLSGRHLFLVDAVSLEVGRGYLAEPRERYNCSPYRPKRLGGKWLLGPDTLIFWKTGPADPVCRRGGSKARRDWHFVLCRAFLATFRVSGSNLAIPTKRGLLFESAVSR